jgi:hypothetical protein
MSSRKKDLIKNHSVCLTTLKRAIYYIECMPAVMDHYDEFWLSFIMEIYAKVEKVEDVETEIEERLLDVLREDKTIKEHY